MSTPISSQPANQNRFQRYTNLINTEQIIDFLYLQGTETRKLLLSLENKGDYAYAPGKWTLKQLTGHLNDSERIFAYRALRFSRNDKTTLASFEEDDYVNNASFNLQSMKDLVEEHYLIRQCNLMLFKGFNIEELERNGVSGETQLTVKELLYIIAGHEQHHINIINERYI